MIKVNSKSLSFAKSLIKDGNVDKTASWEFTAADGNKLLGENDWANYEKWHLAIDDEAEKETKAYYKYPFGKNGKVYRRGVIAIKSRAAADGKDDIRDAADSLLKMIDAKKDSTRVDWLNPPEYMYDKMTTDENGFLSGRAVVTGVGVFTYKDKDGNIRRELRCPEEVFDRDSLKSLEMAVLTDDHPTELVTPENIHKYQAGTLGSILRIDGFNISAEIKVTDAALIKKIKSREKNALSCGYNVELDETPGVWNGIAYDCVQRKIRYNHTAVVDRGRAGDNVVLKLDSIDAYSVIENKNQEDNSMSMKSTEINGVKYDAEAPVIEHLNITEKRVDSLEKENKQLSEDKSQLQAKFDSAQDELKKVKADLEEAKKINPANVDAAVNEKLSLIKMAEKAGINVDKQSSEELKKAVVLKVYPEAKLDGVEPAYLQARFDCACESLEKSVNVDNQNKTNVADVNHQPAINSDSAYKKHVEDLKNAWKEVK